MRLLALCLLFSSTAALQALPLVYNLINIDISLSTIAGLRDTVVSGGFPDYQYSFLMLNASDPNNVRSDERAFGVIRDVAVDADRGLLYMSAAADPTQNGTVQVGEIRDTWLGPMTTIWSSADMVQKLAVNANSVCMLRVGNKLTCMTQSTVIGTTPPSIIVLDVANDGSTFYLLGRPSTAPEVKSVFALDVASFELRNVTRVPAGSSSLTAAHGVVYVAGDELLTIDGSTGRTLGRLLWGVPRVHGVVYNGGVVYLQGNNTYSAYVFGVNVSNLAAPFVQYMACTLTTAISWTAFGSSLWALEAGSLSLFRTPDGPPPFLPTPSPPTPSPTPKPTPSPTPKPTPSPTPMCAVCLKAPCCDPYVIPQERCPDLSPCCDCGTDSCQCPSA